MTEKKKEKGVEPRVAKETAAILYLVIAIIFSAALVQGVSSYSEVQRAQVVFKAKLSDFNFIYDANFVNMTVSFMFMNPSKLEISVYNIGVNFGIYNASQDEVIDLGLMNNRTIVSPGKSEIVNMTMKIDRRSDNPRLKVGVDSMHLGSTGIERMWVLSGIGDCYILPANFYCRVDVSAVVWK